MLKTKKDVKIFKLLRSKEFITQVLLNEKFYKENKDKSLNDILNSEEVKNLSLKLK